MTMLHQHLTDAARARRRSTLARARAGRCGRRLRQRLAGHPLTLLAGVAGAGFVAARLLRRLRHGTRWLAPWPGWLLRALMTQLARR